MNLITRGAVLVAAFSVVGAASAQNLMASLADGGWEARIGNSTAGAALPTSSTTTAHPSMNFNPTGASDSAFSGWWHYRVGSDTRERTFANATARTVSGNTVDWDFGMLGAGGTAISGLSARMNYRLIGVSADVAYIFTDLDITNNSGVSQTVDSYYTIDIDLGGTAGADVVAPLLNASGLRTWTVTDGTWTAKVSGVNPFGSGAGGFSAIVGQMTDSSIDNFSPDLNAGGLASASDYAQLHQFRNTIANGQTMRSSAIIALGRNSVNPQPVPEPATMTVLGLGVAALARRRKSKKS